MLSELDILKDVTSKFDDLGIQYMLTGSLALSYYTQPRMTRDIDLVVEIDPALIDKFAELFRSQYYLSVDAIVDAIERELMFNIIHNESSIKVDCIVRKNSEYRKTEFERRKRVQLSDFNIFIVSCEDLIISKLFWIKESNSELQKNDVKNLLKTEYDKKYLLKWIKELSIENIYKTVKDE